MTPEHSSPHLPLHQRMSRAGLSQAALAAWCGVSQATISRVLAGRQKASPAVVAGACSLLGVERPAELFDL